MPVCGPGFQSSLLFTETGTHPVLGESLCMGAEEAASSMQSTSNRDGRLPWAESIAAPPGEGSVSKGEAVGGPHRLRIWFGRGMRSKINTEDLRFGG